MAKSINWSSQFLQAVQSEPQQLPYIALRLGALYYDNQYWVPDEVVDIRVNNEVIRKGQVVAPVRLTTIGALTSTEFEQLKSPLKTVTAVIDYLQQTYQPDEPITEQTVITVVEYINLDFVLAD
jgi:hypothetical protein